MAESERPNEGELILYQTPEGAVRIEVLYESETFWLNQKKIAELFGVDVRTVSEHFRNIFGSNELDEAAVLRKIRITAADGKNYVTNFYNLDAIISVGYRVNSTQATQFRIWATQTLREFVIKGFVLDDERLKLNKRFGKDYFDELLAPSASAKIKCLRAILKKRSNGSRNGSSAYTDAFCRSTRIVYFLLCTGLHCAGKSPITSSNAATISSVCPVVRLTRRHASPSGTVGGRMAGTKKPRPRRSADN